MEKIKSLVLAEPARTWLIARAFLYLLGTLGLAWFTDANLEPILSFFALLLGVDITSTERGVRSQVYAPDTVTELLKVGNFLPNIGPGWLTEVGKFVFGLIQSRVDHSQYPEAMKILAPLLAQYAGSNLTAELRGQIQHEIHVALRKAGLIKKTTIPARAGAISLLLLLASCAPVTNLVTDAVTDTANNLTADGATVSYTSKGALFEPGGADSLENTAEIIGEQLQFYDAEDKCSSKGDYWQCERPLVASADTWLIELSGVDLSVTVTFERADGVTHQALPE